ncbi:MAG: hypothetical protein ACP5SH_17835 [Syntrophobacteraceae bacterium]
MKKQWIYFSFFAAMALALAPISGIANAATPGQHNDKKAKPVRLQLAQYEQQQRGPGDYRSQNGEILSLSPRDRMTFDRLRGRERDLAMRLPPPQLHAFLRLNYRERRVFTTLPHWQRKAFLALTPRERDWFVTLPPEQRVAFLYLSPEQMREFIALEPVQRQEVIALPSTQYYAFFSLAPAERNHFFALRPHERQGFISSRERAPRETEQGQPQQVKPGGQAPAQKTLPPAPGPRERESGTRVMKPGTQAPGAAAPQKGIEQHEQMTPGSQGNTNP